MTDADETVVEAVPQVAATEGKKKKKKKSKKDTTTTESANADAQDKEEADDVDEDKEDVAEEESGGQTLNKNEELIQVLRRARVCEESRRQTERKHPFWDTQPVPSIGSEYGQDCGPIDENKSPDDVRSDPYPLPDAFEWCMCNVNDDAEIKEVYTLLSENYVEDDDSMFRFDYSVEFLRWALTPPGYLQAWHLGVRVKNSHKLVGFITGIPAHMYVYDKVVKMTEINFLCVHKKLRSKRLAPVLIKEITRRVNKENVWQAVYTAGVVLPRPVSECRYWHRSLNPKKLIEVGFSYLGPRMTINRTVKLYKVPAQPQLPGMRMMVPDDVPRVHEILQGYLKKFSLHPDFSPEEVGHWLLPRANVVYSYVRVDSNGQVSDFCSFYSLPSSILGNEKYSLLKAAYSFWNVATTVSMTELMQDALILAKAEDFDVFNALNIMDNESFLKDLKFGVGDGFLQYYLYNWKCPRVEPTNIGLVLL